MDHWALEVPTYYGARNAALDEVAEDFAPPSVPVLVSEAHGLRIVLGTHDVEDVHMPDIQIERRPNGWAIFIHPDACDPCALIYMMDDGRSYCVVENYVSEPLQIVKDRPREIDGL
jgi:hypothetical protein